LNAIPRGALPRSLGQENLAALELLLPPPEDQRRILEALSNIERKIALLRSQNQVLRGIIRSLFDHYFITGEGSPRPLGDFVECRDLGIKPGLGPGREAPLAGAAGPSGASGPLRERGTVFYNLFLRPRGDLHPLFAAALVGSGEFLAYAKNCREHRGGTWGLNRELVLGFELSGPAGKTDASFPAGCYREFNRAAEAAGIKHAANRAELGVLEQLRRGLFPS
jgi:hypothetical protein